MALRTNTEMRTVVVLRIFYLLETDTCLFAHGNCFLVFLPSSHYFIHQLLEINFII